MHTFENIFIWLILKISYHLEISAKDICAEPLILCQNEKKTKLALTEILCFILEEQTGSWNWTNISLAYLTHDLKKPRLNGVVTKLGKTKPGFFV